MAVDYIKRVDFESYQIDLDSSEQAINLIYKDENNNNKRVWVGKNISFDLKDDTFELNVQSGKRAMTNSMMVYTKETLFLEPIQKIKAHIKEILDADKDAEVAVVKTMGSIYVGKNVKNLEIYSSKLIDADFGNEKKARTASEQKNDLNAYETPTKTHDLTFGIMQKQIFTNLLKDYLAKDILLELYNAYADAKADSSLPEKDLEKQKTELMREIRSALSEENSNILHLNVHDAIASEFNSTLAYKLESGANTRASQIKSYILKYAPQILERYKQYGSSPFPINEMVKNGESIHIPTFPILDFQAGSGRDILQSSKTNNIPIKLFGSEIRTKEEMGITEEDENNAVFNNMNFMLIKDDYKSVFGNKQLKNATSNAIVYSNPPYTINNHTAKESVLSIGHGSLVFGLFPTSMENFLKENIKGHIFIVDRELTGYTDPTTPQNFLYVVGERFDADYEENRIAELKEKGLFAYGGKVEGAKNKTTALTNVDVATALTAINIEINKFNAEFNFPLKMKNAFDYYNNEPERVNVLANHLYPKFVKTEEMISNIDKIKDGVEQNKDTVFASLGSEALLESQRIFPDTRMYVKDGKVDLKTYAEVLSDLSLLVSYRDNNPEILSVVKKISASKNNKLEILDSPSALYKLSAPIKPETKDKITTDNIGLMKNYYFPSSFSLQDVADKNLMMEVVSYIAEKKGSSLSQEDREKISYAIDKATKMATKNEEILEDGKISKASAFVFVDDMGTDISKLNVSLTDFYSALEDKKIFDIKDYIEKGVIQEEKKDKIIDSFLKQMENIKYIYQEKSGNNIEADILDGIKKLISLQKSLVNNKISDNDFEEEKAKIYINFYKKNKIDSFFEESVGVTSNVQKLLSRDIKKNILFSENSKKEKDSLVAFIEESFTSNPISFFDDMREQHVEELKRRVLELNKDITNDDMQSFVLQIYDNLSDEYVKRKSIFEGSVRISQMLIKDYGMMHYMKKANPSIANHELYDKFFRNMALNTLGLMNHQFDSVESFLSISNETKLDMMMWEMRAGKTLAFLNSMWLLSLYRDKDALVLVETKNLNDITSQMLTHMPQMFTTSNYVMPKSQLKDSILSEKNIYSHLTMADYYPNLPVVLKPYYSGRGNMADKELATFGFEFEELLQTVKDKEINVESLLEEYADSEFKEILTLCK